MASIPCYLSEEERGESACPPEQKLAFDKYIAGENILCDNEERRFMARNSHASLIKQQIKHFHKSQKTIVNNINHI